MAQQQSADKYGIVATKPTVGILTTSITAVANLDTNQDGDIQVFEILNALQVVALKVIRQVPNIQQLRLELTDLSEEEKHQLYKIVQQDISMPAPKLEYLVERALNIIIDLVDFIMEVQKPEEEFESA